MNYLSSIQLFSYSGMLDRRIEKNKTNKGGINGGSSTGNNKQKLVIVEDAPKLKSKGCC